MNSSMLWIFRGSTEWRERSGVGSAVLPAQRAGDGGRGVAQTFTGYHRPRAGGKGMLCDLLKLDGHWQGYFA